MAMRERHRTNCAVEEVRVSHIRQTIKGDGVTSDFDRVFVELAAVDHYLKTAPTLASAA